MPLLRVKKKKTKRVISGPGAAHMNLINSGAIMREELHRLVGKHKKLIKEGTSPGRAQSMMKKIEELTARLEALSTELDE